MRCLRDNEIFLLVTLMWLQTTAYSQTQAMVEYTGNDEIEVVAGSHQMIDLHFSILSDFYIQGPHPENEAFIPTALKITLPDDIIVGEIQYPSTTAHTYGEGLVSDIYKEDIIITLPVSVSTNAASAGDLYINGNLYYQACSKMKCYYPRTLDFRVRLVVKGKTRE